MRQTPVTQRVSSPGIETLVNASVFRPFAGRYNFDSVAQVAELADALGSGPSGLRPVGVQVPPWALSATYFWQR
jgi:hypothetical protein